MALARRTRPHEPEAPSFVQQWINWGAGPRASQNMILAAKAHALLQGRFHVATEDVDAVAPAVLRHRILTNFAAQAEGISADDVIARLIEETEAHPSALDGERATGIGS
jgi:MoxR-like ATPase